MIDARWIRFVAAAVTLLLAWPVRAVEPWADKKLAPPDGLELWIDAGRVAAAREAAGLPKLKSGDRLAEWPDASGAKRQVVQGDSKRQPKFVQVGSADGATSSTAAPSANDNWVVRFDGEDDHLRALGVNRKLTDFTLFVVAAPHSNFGDYRGLFAVNQTDRRDYETGFNLDLNSGGTPALQSLNLEGRGFGGARNLMQTAVPFGTLHVIECVADSTQKQVRLAFDGHAGTTRDFAPAELIADDITIGARFPTHGPSPQGVKGFLHGDIAEVLLFNRVLSTDETQSVRRYLEQKHAKLKEALPRDLKLAAASTNVEPLVTVKDAPPIQMLVPGFSVYELPVDLPNLNNVRYRADGKLYALGYNGNIWLLSDTDGDGFEDQADLFFDGQPKGGGIPALRGPIGMAVIPEGHALFKRTSPSGGRESPGSSIDQPNDKPNQEPGDSRPLLGKADGRKANAGADAPEGVVIASKGKVSAIIDWDADGKADEEKIIATGWKEIPQNVDAVGVAIGHQGEIYFGIGTAAYNNAYLIDEAGKAQFDIESERGTIQRILPDLSRRETVCTGIRFPIGLATNGITTDDDYEHLFASDQEGATWLPNGNPFDELLQIQPGKHYGFPPRHPKHLPNVVDEPSLFDYGPQHQSTCGMAFNLPWRGRGSEQNQTTGDPPISDPQPSTLDPQPIFGPEEWEMDLFVTGESRGKLYRTQLKMTNGQYVARNHLIACLNMLTVDCCLSPQGDLVVCCHSGGPDWGTGPTGKGKVFVIKYTDKKIPQPIATWTAGPQEVRVAFDRPLDPVHLKNLTAQTKITYGEFVAAGDRFETLRPGYAVVQRQMSSPRYNLPVHGVSVTPDRRTLVIATAPHRAAVQYALTLPGLGRRVSVPLARSVEQSPTNTTTQEEKDGQARRLPYEQPQHPQIDLAYSLNGVLATWEPEDKSQRGWSGVLPHLDLSLCDEFSTEDADNDRFHEILKQKGTLTLETQLDLRNLLHPAVQPGSKLDHEWPSETIGLEIEGAGTKSQPLQVFLDGTLKTVLESGAADGDHANTILSTVLRISDKAKSVRLKIVVGTNDTAPVNSVNWSSDATDPAPLALSRFLVPWADLTAKGTSHQDTKRDIPELAGGSWGRGRRVFFSDEAGCAKCHVAHGSGGAIGADLSNLIHRDYASVLRDVTLPSFAINPDYLASVVTLKDGRVLTGIVREVAEVRAKTSPLTLNLSPEDGGEGTKPRTPHPHPLPTTEAAVPEARGEGTGKDTLFVGDKDGKVHTITRGDIDEMRHSPLSIMPEGLPQKLGPERMRDLLTFLLTEPPHMPSDAKLPAPKPRTRAEVAKVLALEERAVLVPSPPSSGERARVRGPSGEKTSPRSSDPILPPSPRRGGPGRGADERGTQNAQTSPLPNPPPQGEGTKPKPEDGRTPHPNPLPSKAKGEGTGRSINILLVAGAKDHEPGEHDYPAWLRVWSELLRGAEGVTVATAMEWPSPEQLAAADTIAFFQKGAWNAERAQAIDAHLAKGGGLVYIHWAVEGDAQAPAFAQRIGLASHAAKLKYRHGPLDLSFESLGLESGSAHPIGRNFDKVHFHDESYWLMQGDPTKVKLIATGMEDGEPRPLFWTFEPAVPNAKQQGRVFVSILGHYSWTFDDPLFRILLLRGIAWSTNEPIDRFNELATIGVTLAE